jgi:3-deoxy-D-manno-octulosonate 8-phosphate phosphatase (KDO 8-P phosphatase)
VIEPALAQRIRLVGVDVDGTMTDGGIYVAADAAGRPVEAQRFDIQDGLGIHLLRAAGLPVVLITGRASEAARLRARALEVDEFVSEAAARKLEAFEAVLLRRGIAWEEVSFVGDDLPDLPILRRVALPVAVANAAPEVRAVVRWTTVASGGHGAVREFSEALLRARGNWAETVERYLAERGGGAVGGDHGRS